MGKPKGKERATQQAVSSPEPGQQPDVNTVKCGVCGHVGAPMPDGECPNNNCPTRG